MNAKTDSPEYDNEPKTLDALLVQVHAWDGDVLRVEPHFDNDFGPGMRSQFHCVTIWVRGADGQEDCIDYRWQSSPHGGYWTLC